MSAITALLHRAADGESVAVQQLFAVLYPEIRRIAQARLAEAGGVTGLNTTALVHEGFLKMADTEGLKGRERLQFLAYVGRALRSVVLDHLRAEAAEKRGGGIKPVTLSHADEVADSAGLGADLRELDAALARMKVLDETLAATVEMHFFTGMTIAEIASAREVSTRTVDRDLKKARLLLAELLEG